jgi:protein-S-isoprenylcysteine O-methyltransferase Ste14
MRLYIKPLYFDIINLAFVNLVFFLFYREAIAGLLILRAAIGTPIILLSFYFESISHKVFQNAHRRPEEIRKLVTSGIYSKVRHPIYLGRMLLNIGFLIMFPIIPMLFVAIVFVIVWYLMALSEEMFLMKKFSKSYKKYKEKVPMFIPKK